MDKRQPQRLTNEQFMLPFSSFNIYHQIIHERFELHWHEFYELCFILSGKGANIVNGTEYSLSRGSVFLLTPADFHEIYPEPGYSMELLNIIFSEQMIGDELYHMLFKDMNGHRVRYENERCEQMESEFRKIWTEAKECKWGHKLVVRGALERILVELCRSSAALNGQYEHNSSSASEHKHNASSASQHEHTVDAKPSPARGQHPAVHKALIYIHHHFRESLTLECAARQAQLAPNYFSDCFRKTTGVSFQSYLQELRLKFAMSLLCASDLPVTEICHSSGFNTLTHFERAFKQKFGQPPRAFRTSGRESSPF